MVINHLLTGMILQVSPNTLPKNNMDPAKPNAISKSKIHPRPATMSNKNNYRSSLLHPKKHVFSESQTKKQLWKKNNNRKKQHKIWSKTMFLKTWSKLQRGENPFRKKKHLNQPQCFLANRQFHGGKHLKENPLLHSSSHNHGPMEHGCISKIIHFFFESRW